MRILLLYIVMGLMIGGALRPPPAHAEERQYRVPSQPPTLFQLAREIYKDQRRWQDIACRNGLRSPFQLEPGTTLILPAGDMTRECAAFSVQRDLREEKDGTLVYIVNDRAPSLSAVARDLYGDLHMAKSLAQQNGLAKDARLSPGQRLTLSKKPTLTAQEGTQVLIQYWTQLGNHGRVLQLQGGNNPETPIVRKTPAPPPVAKAVPPAPVTPPARVRASPPAAQNFPPAPAAESPSAPSRAVSTVTDTPAEFRIPASTEEKQAIEHRRSEGYWLGEESDKIIKIISEKLRVPEKDAPVKSP